MKTAKKQEAKLTKKQKDILIDATARYIREKRFQEMIYGVSIIKVAYKKRTVKSV